MNECGLQNSVERVDVFCFYLFSTQISIFIQKCLHSCHRGLISWNSIVLCETDLKIIMSRFHLKTWPRFFKTWPRLKKRWPRLKKRRWSFRRYLGEWVKRIFVTYFHLGRLAFRKLKRSDGSEGTFCIFQLIFYLYYTLPFS